jgi:hypothetical protein
MTSPFRVFRSSGLWTDCEECRLRVNLSSAGACRRCRRVLCNSHLHGSFFRRLLVDLGAEPVCLRCRREALTSRQ